MTAEHLRDFKNKVPFNPFIIYMSDGKKFELTDPESLVLPRDWTVDALVLHPRGRFSFVYIRNVTHVTSGGSLPRFKGKRGRGRGGNGEGDR